MSCWERASIADRPFYKTRHFVAKTLSETFYPKIFDPRDVSFRTFHFRTFWAATCKSNVLMQPNYLTHHKCWCTGYATRMDLVLNGNTLANVYRTANDHNGIRTRSRSFMYYLSYGHQLRIQVPSGFQLYSADNRLTTFSGFLVYPY